MKKVTDKTAKKPRIKKPPKAEKAPARGIYEAMFEANPSVMLLVDPGTACIVDANEAARKFYGYTAEEFRGKKISELNLMPDEQIRDAVQMAFTSATTKFHFNHRLANGDIRNVEVLSGPINIDGKDLLHSIITDETDRIKSEWNLELQAATSDAIARLASSMDTTASLEEISAIVLDHAQKFTGSPYGFVGYIDPATGHMISPTLTRGIWETCRVGCKEVVFKKFTGLWGWVLENKQTLIVNDLKNEPRKAGVPDGHIGIDRFLGAPCVIGGKLVGMIGLANATHPYSLEDVNVIERLADLYSIAVRRWLDEEELRKHLNISDIFAEFSRAALSTASIEEISDMAGEVAKRLTRSEYSYAGYISSETGAPVARPLDPEIREACKMEKKNDLFHAFNGLWGWVLKNRKPIITNDPANDLRSFGTPDGHIPIKNFLSAPAAIGDRLVGQVSVANAKATYTDEDLRHIERIADVYALAIQRHFNEEAIRNAADEWETTFDAMPDKVLILDREHNIVRANKSFIESIELRQNEITGTFCYHYVHGTECAMSACPHKKTIEDGKQHTFEFFEPKFQRHFMVSTSPINGSDGSVVGSVHVMRDISEQKTAENALRDSLQTSSDILSAMPAGLFIFTRKSRFKLVLADYNPEAENVFGQSLKPWIGRNFAELWPSVGVSGLFEEIIDALESTGKYQNLGVAFEDDYLARVFTLRAFNMPGDKVGVILENVTERNRLAAIIENIRAGVMQFDGDNRVVYVNTRFLQIFGSNETSRSMNILDYIPGEESASIVRDIGALSSGKSLTMSGRMHFKDKFIEYAAFPLLDKRLAYEGALLIARDVTSEAAEQQRVFQDEKLNSLAVMVAGIAHDLNNPLDGLQNCVRRIRQRPDDAAKNAEYLDLMEKALVKMGHVIRQLIKFSRKDSMQFEVIELPGIVTDAVRFAMKALERPEVEVNLRIRQTVKLWVNGDITALFNVFLNLILNAYDAVEGPGQITVSAEAIEGGMIEAIISDSGAGIAPETLPRIFDPFFTTKSPGKGSGLGLSVSRQAIIQHGGSMRVESALGKGTRFRILLPAVKNRIIAPGTDGG